MTFDWDPGRRQAMMSGNHFDEVRERFSVANKNARFAHMRGYYAPARNYVITPTGRFDLGLYSEIVKFIKDEGYTERIRHTPAFKEVFDNVLSTTDDVEPEKLKLDLRDYQYDVVKKCCKYGRGTVVLATAGGKTLIIATLLETMFKLNPDFKCALIVPDRGLVTQTYNDFKDYNTTFKTTKWTGDDELDLSANVIVCNLGILQSNKSDTDWLTYIDACVVDEVHKLRKGNKVNKLLKKIRTQCRFGFTGTMPEQTIDQWNIMGKIGPVVYEKNSYELRKEKYIADAKIQILKLEYEDEPTYIKFPGESLQPSEMFRREIDFLIHNDFRNDILTKLCNKVTNNALVLVDYIEHGTVLYEQFNRDCADKKVYFIRGNVDIEDREKVKQLMEKDDNVIVVAISKIFSTGINIKNLHYIVFASGGKAKIKIIQSIGRGLRLHKNKDQLIIFDIGDSLRYGTRHLAKRIEFYNRENIEHGLQTIKEKNSIEKENGS
tara:strand:- start:530 stop:2005 length:1476 start_codon:yes stop_codon:yes gene_type:complete